MYSIRDGAVKKSPHWIQNMDVQFLQYDLLGGPQVSKSWLVSSFSLTRSLNWGVQQAWNQHHINMTRVLTGMFFRSAVALLSFEVSDISTGGQCLDSIFVE